MKKIISLLISVSIFMSTTINIFAKENVTIQCERESLSTLNNFQAVNYKLQESAIDRTFPLKANEVIKNNEGEISVQSSDFDSVRFNTITSPYITNGLGEIKSSYKNYLSEEISPYSGELTMRFNDITLPGRNGLDLNIGRIYQTAHTNVVDRSVVALPNENGVPRDILIWGFSDYYNDRYFLGNGWSFNFPSVQVVKDYIPEPIGDTYYYDIEQQLYYHTGNGYVYQVENSSDPDVSNLKGYYKKDIRFNRNDTSFSNEQVTSKYSLTLSDKTKQYFAEDGRLIGIEDRFNNKIIFKHAMKSITSMVPNGNFIYANEMWEDSDYSDVKYVTNKGRHDSTSLKFNRRPGGDTYICSEFIKVEPSTSYDLSASFWRTYAQDGVKIKIHEFDAAYNHRNTRTINVSNLPINQWEDVNHLVSTFSSTIYIAIEILAINGAKEFFVDNVVLDKPKPLISEITNIDSLGRIASTENAVGDVIGFFYENDDFPGNLTKIIQSDPAGIHNTMGVKEKRVDISYDDYNAYVESETEYYLGQTSITEYGYDGNNRLVSVKLNGNTTDEYVYNDVGALIEHNDTTYGYDEWDRLVSFSTQSETYNYKYDYEGIRTQKDNIQYITDSRGRVIAEADENDEVTAQNVYGHKILGRKINGQWYYYIHNVRGDVIGLVNESGEEINSYTYDAWGNILNITETLSNPIRYAGEYTDLETNNIYLRARYYDPSVGRFITEDPIRDGLNWYVYATNNPIMFIDPSGLVLQAVDEDSAAILLRNVHSLTGDSRYQLDDLKIIFNQDAENTLSGGSHTATAMINAAIAQDDIISVGFNSRRSDAQIFSNGVKVLLSNYNKASFLDNRSAIISVAGSSGAQVELDFTHELAHGLTWIMRHDQRVLYSSSVYYQQGDIFNKYMEASAITLANIVSAEKNYGIVDTYTRNTMTISGATYIVEPFIYGAFPFEYTGGRSAIMRSLAHNIDYYYRVNYLR
jgi:RHS repeat-associated protein